MQLISSQAYMFFRGSTLPDETSSGFRGAGSVVKTI